MLYLFLSALLSFEDDSELIERLKRREPQALGDIYDRFGKIAFSIILRVVKNEGIAEHLLQEIFLKVWNRVYGFDQGRGSLGPWILAIARNRAIDYARTTDSRLSQSRSDLEALEKPRFFTNLEADYYNMDRIQTVREAFAKLTENQRQVLELAYFEGLSQNEMAAKLQQPLSRIKTWVRTALQLLRNEFNSGIEIRNETL